MSRMREELSIPLKSIHSGNHPLRNQMVTSYSWRGPYGALVYPQLRVQITELHVSSLLGYFTWMYDLQTRSSPPELTTEFCSSKSIAAYRRLTYLAMSYRRRQHHTHSSNLPNIEITCSSRNIVTPLFTNREVILVPSGNMVRADHRSREFSILEYV